MGGMKVLMNWGELFMPVIQIGRSFGGLYGASSSGTILKNNVLACMSDGVVEVGFSSQVF